MPDTWEGPHGRAKAEVVVQAKFFTLNSNWIWHVLDFDGHDAFCGFDTVLRGTSPECGFALANCLLNLVGHQGLEP